MAFAFIKSADIFSSISYPISHPWTIVVCRVSMIIVKLYLNNLNNNYPRKTVNTMFGGTLVGCKDIEHCPSDAFCDPVELVCRPCIQCADLRRLSPPAPVACITAVAQCGSCFAGLVENKRSLSVACEDAEAGDSMNEWLVTLVALHLLALLLCFCVAIALRNFRAYKLRASTNATTHTLCESSVGTATAPPPPPPYNTTDCVVPSHHMENEETSSPLIKDASMRPDVAATTAAGVVSFRNRETATLQGARVFNEPVYQSLITTSEENNTSLEILQRDPQILDYPRERTTYQYDRASPDPETTLSEGLHYVRPSSARKQRVRQDSMNDSEDSGYGDPYSGAGGAGAGGPNITANNSIPFFINIFKNFTTVTQEYEV